MIPDWFSKEFVIKDTTKLIKQIQYFLPKIPAGEGAIYAQLSARYNASLYMEKLFE